MIKAIRNTSGKAVSAENIDKRDNARNAAVKTVKLSEMGDRYGKDPVDRDYESNRKAQDKREIVKDPITKGD